MSKRSNPYAKNFRQPNYMAEKVHVRAGREREDQKDVLSAKEIDDWYFGNDTDLDDE